MENTTPSSKAADVSIKNTSTISKSSGVPIWLILVLMLALVLSLFMNGYLYYTLSTTQIDSDASGDKSSEDNDETPTDETNEDGDEEEDVDTDADTPVENKKFSFNVVAFYGGDEEEETQALSAEFPEDVTVTTGLFDDGGVTPATIKNKNMEMEFGMFYEGGDVPYKAYEEVTRTGILDQVFRVEDRQQSNLFYYTTGDIKKTGTCMDYGDQEWNAPCGPYTAGSGKVGFTMVISCKVLGNKEKALAACDNAIKTLAIE